MQLRSVADDYLVVNKREKYIQITVRNARTHLNDGKAQFTDFEIELKTNHIAFTLKSSKVRRRYSDFVWLRGRLMKDLMSTEAPSLPGRRLFGRFNKDFIKQRQKKLQEFLFGLVQNNVYLSHKALHLFLQSKMSSEEIDVFLDTNQDEDATETIIAEAEVQARLNGLLTRDSIISSKHDSGISGDYEDSEFLVDQDRFMSFEKNEDDSNFTNNNFMRFPDKKEEEAFLSDGHNADIESEDELDESSLEQTENEVDESEDPKLEEELTRLRLSSLPAPPPEPESGDDRFESSVEISLNYDSSDNSDDDDDDVSDKRTRSHGSYKGGSTSGLNSIISSQENVRTPSKRIKRRYSRQHSSFRKMFHSNVSLPEFGNQTTYDDQSKETDEYGKPLRRSKSFYEYRTQRMNTSSSSSSRRRSEIFGKQGGGEGSFSDCKSPVRQSNSFSNTPRKLRRAPSFLSSTERTPVKRKISLNEYIIVGRNSFAAHKTNDEFNKTSL